MLYNRPTCIFFSVFFLSFLFVFTAVGEEIVLQIRMKQSGTFFTRRGGRRPLFRPAIQRGVLSIMVSIIITTIIVQKFKNDNYRIPGAGPGRVTKK